MPKKFQWTPGASLFPAETCARQIYFGTCASYVGVPPELLKKEGSLFPNGRAAYVHAVSFCTGLKGVDRFDKEVSGQVRQAWLNYQTSYPESHKGVLPFVEALLHDAKMVKSSVIEPHLRRTTIQNIAVEMAHLSPKDEVLVVGGADTLTLETLTALGHRKKCNPGSIVLTHPVTDRMHAIVRLLKDLPAYRQINVPLRLVPFQQAMSGDINNISAVFVAHPMVSTDDLRGSTQEDLAFDYQISEKLCAAWQARLCSGAAGGRLIHLKGNPRQRCETTGSWLGLEAQPCGFVSHMALMRERTARIQTIKRVTLRAKEAIDVMAAGRLDPNGERVVKSIDVSGSDLQLTIGWSRRSRGIDHHATCG